MGMQPLFPGFGQRLGSQNDSSVEMASQFIIQKVFSKLYQHTPAPFISFLQNSFWKVPAAAFTVTLLYDKTIVLDAAFAASVGLVSIADRKISNSKLIKATTLSLCALHLLQLGYNSYKCISDYQHSFAISASLDLCIAAKCGLIVLNKN
jgi:hypothetical protein